MLDRLLIALGLKKRPSDCVLLEGGGCFLTQKSSRIVKER